MLEEADYQSRYDYFEVNTKTRVHQLGTQILSLRESIKDDMRLLKNRKKTFSDKRR